MERVKTDDSTKGRGGPVGYPRRSLPPGMSQCPARQRSRGSFEPSGQGSGGDSRILFLYPFTSPPPPSLRARRT